MRGGSDPEPSSGPRSFREGQGAGTAGDLTTDLPACSVVVVSRNRPDALALCLSALALQDHPRMEVVLVADPAGLAVRPDLAIKRVAFDRPNISQARNHGIMVAAGEVVAFIDDDAIAEPTWARRLAQAFVDPGVIAATGWTRGPHGVRWQVQAEAITPFGPVRLPEFCSGHDPSLFRPSEGKVLSTLGTNCAFRRDALLAIGGFDPAFAYHLDESDLNMRLARHFPDAASALVPLAQVIHGTAPSERRDAARVPRDLRMIGRSEAIFARRHGGDPDRIADRYRRRLLRQMLAGRIDPMRIRPLLASLTAGMDEVKGAATPSPASPLLAQESGFAALPTHARDSVWLSGWIWQRQHLQAQAREAVASGAVVTLLLQIPGVLAHRTRFVSGGWWEQTGGSQGRSWPGDPVFMAMTARQRSRREWRELLPVRATGPGGLPCPSVLTGA